MRTLDSLLAETTFFQGCPPTHLATAAGCAINVRFHHGEMLIREGEEAAHFYVIRDGRVASEIHSPGRRRIVIETLGPGDVVGFSWLIPPYISQLDARALTDVKVISFDAKCLRKKCEADPALGYDLLKRVTAVLNRRLHAATTQMLDLYGHPHPVAERR